MSMNTQTGAADRRASTSGSLVVERYRFSCVHYRVQCELGSVPRQKRNSRNEQPGGTFELAIATANRDFEFVRRDGARCA